MIALFFSYADPRHVMWRSATNIVKEKTMNEEILIELGEVSEETKGAGGESFELENNEKK